MQATRQRILAILRERGQASVKDLAAVMGLTPMAVRHHLHTLRGEGLVHVARVERRGSPGRPPQLYSLTPAGRASFPDGSQRMSHLLLADLHQSLPSRDWEWLVGRLVQRITPSEMLPRPDAPLPERLERAAVYLRRLSVEFRWHAGLDGEWLLRTACPFGVPEHRGGWACDLHRAMLGRLLGVSQEALAWAAPCQGGCTYRLGGEADGAGGPAA